MTLRHPDGAALFLLLLGLVPLVGLATLGHWPRWETGLGTVLVVLALRELWVGR